MPKQTSPDAEKDEQETVGGADPGPADADGGDDEPVEIPAVDEPLVTEYEPEL